MGITDGAFAVVGLSRAPFSDASKVRKVVKCAFEASKLPQTTPHRFREMLVSFGSDVCATPAEFKAWSMNLGHDSVVKTLSACCNIPVSTQRNLMKRTAR